MANEGEYDDENGIEARYSANSGNSGAGDNDVSIDDIPLVDIPVQVGWICPICHYGVSPFASYCPCRD